jgi:serine/threonine protein kinase
MAISKALLDIATNKTNKERDHSTGPLSKESSMPALLDYTNQHPSDTRARWTHIKYLGHGGQGDVSKVQEISSGKQFARKAMRFTVWEYPVRDDEERERREAIVREEVSIMQKLRHVHVATVLFTMRERESFDFIMLPVADKDLSSFLKDCTTKHYLAAKRNLLPRWMGCLMNALAFAHEQSIRHKDIKPSNILVKGDHVFLTDFGLAVDFADADVSYTTNSFRGTLHYKAPESRPGNVHGRAADIFGLGCVFSEMLTVYGMKAVVDFDKQRQGPTYSEANAFHLNLPEVKSWVLGLRSDAVSNFLVEMILNMLQEDPLLRSKAGELRASFEKEERLCCDLCRMARP